MILDTIFSFLAMGGYALYVWLAYGVVCVVLLANALYLVHRLKQTKRMLKYRLEKIYRESSS